MIADALWGRSSCSCTVGGKVSQDSLHSSLYFLFQQGVGNTQRGREGEGEGHHIFISLHLCFKRVCVREREKDTNGGRTVAGCSGFRVWGG